MILKLRTGNLEKTIKSKRRYQIPFTETIQHVEVTKCHDGNFVEDEAYIEAEKQKKLEVLRKKYGEMDENEITWVMVKKS